MMQLMSMFSSSRTCLLRSVLPRKLLVSHGAWGFRIDYTVSSAMFCEDQLFDDSPVSESGTQVEELAVPRKRVFKKRQRRGLHPVVVTVVKTLDFHVARKMRFHKAVSHYGFPHSMRSFRMIVHAFAFAGMEREVQALLRDIVCYYTDVEMDVSELFWSLLDSPEHVGGLDLVFNELIKLFAATKMLENGFDAFLHAKKIGIQLKISSCNFLLKCLFEGNQAEMAKKLFGRLKDFGPSPNVYTYTIMINSHCKGYFGQTSDISKANEILNEMKSAGVSPTVVTYGTYIDGLCRGSGDHVEQALQCIWVLRSNNRPVNSYYYNAVIYGFCRIGEPYRALKLLEEIRSFGFSPDVYTYSILIDGFCKKGDILKGLHMVDEMVNFGLKPSIVSYTSLLCGLCKHGLMDAASKIFFDNVAKKYRDDATAGCIIIDGYLIHDETESALKLVEEMTKNDLVPDSIIFKRLITKLCKAGFLIRAMDVLEMMTEVGVLPSIFTCNVIIDRYGREGYLEEACRFLSKVQHLGIVPNSYTYNALIKWLCKEHKSEKAWELLPLMFKNSVFPCVIHYSSLIDGFAKESKLERAWRLYEQMLKVGITPDNVTSTILINMFSCRKNMFIAYNLFREMEEKGLKPDEITYTSVVSGFCRVGDMESAYALCEEMRQKGQPPNIFTYTCLVYGHCMSEWMNEATMVIDEMKRKDIAPDLVTYTVLCVGYERLRNFVKAREVFEEMFENKLLPGAITYATWRRMMGGRRRLMFVRE